MKCQLILRAGLLLLWILTASVSCADPEIKVSELANGIKLSCGAGNEITNADDKKVEVLDYKDENTGEYKCVRTLSPTSSPEPPPSTWTYEPKIYVKFRTCDNCVELDEASITGIVVGDVVATIVIGVAVYLIASQARTGPVTSQKKSSDKKHLLPHETNSSRHTDDNYQPLKARHRDTYDVLKK
ncbi:T-cell surface glycoprotein CD3 delta chain-like [Epinephelus fuscoguttatus]|uniref:T-cell surface glycoprotein CD3 delta chain-like n=1 Tax=Epinephelus fuscoguttatus TaxID=293821 RepID=UPI0020D0F0F0|nr:T-cell surface glycoprotein CD3 delta chain-like [Epinephelus fuscoguttatus]